MLPKTLRILEDYAFDLYTTVHVSDDCEIRAIRDGTKLRFYDNVKINESLPSDIKTLKIIELPEGLERIGSYWFAKSQARRVVVPVSVRKIGSHAFEKCKTLQDVVFSEGS